MQVMDFRPYLMWFISAHCYNQEGLEMQEEKKTPTDYPSAVYPVFYSVGIM